MLPPPQESVQDLLLDLLNEPATSRMAVLMEQLSARLKQEALESRLRFDW